MITRFSTNIEGISIPQKFTFPFYYDPHPLAIIATEELKEYIQNQDQWDHNFGISPEKEGLVIGKMFGVLVVKDSEGKLGYLSAFSGKLDNSNHHRGFVPPVFDMLERNSFFKEGETILNALNHQIDLLESSTEYKNVAEELAVVKKQAAQKIAEGKARVKEGKLDRKKIREEAVSNISEHAYIDLQEKLRIESIKSNYYLKDLMKYWNDEVAKKRQAFQEFHVKIESWKTERKERSAALQKRLFERYTFLNANNEQKSLLEIFENSVLQAPPAGAGECAAPKLLQYAFLHNLEPICMAEFWWGQSPAGEVRKSGSFYPACRGKCEPILGHMLSATLMDPNPMLENPAEGKELSIIYEDNQLVIINKPSEFLSVPGKNIEDSVQTRMKLRYPDATGPLVVHRLDMSTSGIMLIAKDEGSYKYLQRQFVRREVEKKYVAVLEGQIKEREGLIDLPLRVNLDDRPRQMICYEHGKRAKTRYKVINYEDQRTRINFYPETGRTHQLRIHAAHRLGLGCPIVGDDLYGTKEDRLHLHAQEIIFTHPKTKSKMVFSTDAPF